MYVCVCIFFQVRVWSQFILIFKDKLIFSHWKSLLVQIIVLNPIKISHSHYYTILHVLNGILRPICGTFPFESGIIQIAAHNKCHEMAWLLLYSWFLRTYGLPLPQITLHNNKKHTCKKLCCIKDTTSETQDNCARGASGVTN